jgi:hypothetical protein
MCYESNRIDDRRNARTQPYEEQCPSLLESVILLRSPLDMNIQASLYQFLQREPVLSAMWSRPIMQRSWECSIFSTETS